MIGFKINGRLGNQLFQLAAAYSLSRQNGKQLQILPDERSGSFLVEKYFDTHLPYPISWRIIKSIIQILPTRLKHRGSKLIYMLYYPLMQLKMYQSPDPMKIDPDFYTIEDNFCIDGYFQSEYYFKNIAGEIKEKFKIKSQFVNEWKKWYAKLPNHQKLIAVHIRLGDYRNQAGWNLGASDLTLPASYYLNLIKQHSEEGNLFIVMSDEPDTVRTWLPESSNIIYSTESAIIDLITLTQSHSCILSHSSFSWWGAWLNTKENITVYVPKYFLGYKIKQTVPEDIIPASWIQIEVPNEN